MGNGLRCIAAYVTLSRFSGKCGLLLFGERGLTKKEREVHSFSLCFNHEGIKKHTVKKLTLALGKHWQDDLAGYVRIDFGEAVSLLQDAYQQNLRFGTVSAVDWAEYEVFLETKLLDIDRVQLLQKFSFGNMTPLEVANIYLSALKGMDSALLYDLSSPERQKRLGSRVEFLLSPNQIISSYTFLKSQVRITKKYGKRRMISAYIIVSTPEDEIMKIDYNLVLLRYGLVWCLDGLQELSRNILAAEHPENPTNYRVFCSVYHFSDVHLIRNWLEGSPDIFLTGEFEGALCYKLLRTEEVPSKEIDVFSGIISEFMLTEKELFIYAQKPFCLAKKEKLLVQTCQDKIQFKQKYNLPVRKLYQAALQGLSLAELLNKDLAKPGMLGFPALSAFLHWQDYEEGCNKLMGKALHKLQLDGETLYCFIERKKRNPQEIPVFIECYISGNWLRLNVYNGNLKEEINKLGLRVEVIKEREFGKQNRCVLIPHCQKQQWKMCKMLNLMGREAPSLKAMGLIPSVRGLARRVGAIVQ